MTPQQQLLLALLTPIATLAVVMIGFLYNNSRMNDLKSEVNSRISDLKSEVNSRLNDSKSDAGARMNDLKADIQARLAEFQSSMREQQRAQSEAYDAKLARLEEIMLHKFAELDNRLIRIEHKHS